MLTRLLALSMATAVLLPSPAVADDVVICGPRSVQAVLASYGRAEDLIALMHEIQGTDVENGCHVGDLEQALRRRGIGTAVARVPSVVDMRWPHPAIVHLKPVPGRSMGHFIARVVKNNKVKYLSGVDEYSESRVRAEQSGVVLLTSPSPIGSLAGLDVPYGYRVALSHGWLLGPSVILVVSAWIGRSMLGRRRVGASPAVE